MVEIKEALAKSIGVNLVNHNKNVGIVSEYIAKRYLNINDDELLTIIRISGLLHDIGKIHEEFQKILKNKANKKNRFRHNEIGGAFLYLYLNHSYFKYISNSVYWHHGISNKLSGNSINEILNTITDYDISMLKSIVGELIGDTYVYQTPRQEYYKSPKFYLYETEDIYYNEKFSIIRTCVISADRIVSYLETQVHNLTITDKIFSNIDEQFSTVDCVLIDKLNKNLIINTNQFDEFGKSLNGDRFKRQVEIVNSCSLNTTIIKAPAGFGKTIVGLMWAALNNKKTLWVCPRNEVAKSVYYSILNELNKLGLNNVTVELYLTSRTVEKNHANDGEFNSDIIVTNIDNFLSPSVSDSIADRLFITHTANIVFDEYHEFVSQDAYFACFVNMMRARHRYTNSRTLLLSATPINIEYLWNTIERNTLILPNQNSHYPAMHDKKYKLLVESHIKPNPKNSELVVYNSIFESQLNKKNSDTSILFHSGYNESDIREKFNTIFELFGENKPRNISDSVIGTLIMQASFNVSFKNLYESLLSPEATLQRIGRCNRFGDYDGTSMINVGRVADSNGVAKSSRSEASVIELLYDTNLSSKWFETLSEYNNNELTLDELYVIYNAFNLRYCGEIKKYVSKRHNDSLLLLSDVYPYKFNGKKNTNIITAGSNKLRSSGNEMFYLVRLYNDPDKYVGLFSTKIYKTIAEDFQEEGDIRNKLLGSMEIIMKNENNQNIDYSEILENKKNITIDDIRKFGRKSNTPYIRYDVVYHPKFGLIDVNKMERLLN